MAYNRVSARRGNPVELDVSFFRGGVLHDPYAIYRVEIFRGSVREENIVDAIDVPDPNSSDYPGSDITKLDDSNGDGGKYRLIWDVPKDAVAPDIYFDVWYFFGEHPSTSDSTAAESQLINVQNRFWVYPDKWYADGGLTTIRFDFEPLDIKFRKPEIRPLELGVMPLPLYDFDFNHVSCLLPYLEPTISIFTENCELLVEDEPCTIKIRQGSYRVNPFVISYNLDTSRFLIGTYRYRITVPLPDGTTRVSKDYYLTIH